MDLETAEAILQGTASYTAEELSEAGGLVLDELARLRGAAGWVVVTLAPNDVIHAYGRGAGQPMPTRSLAQSLAKKLAASDEKLYPEDPDRVRFRVCKVLGDRP